MNRERLHRVLDRLAAHAEKPGVSVGDALCATAVDVVAVDGAGITIHDAGGPPYSLGVAGRDMAAIHELERTLGEGPCVDAYRTGAPTSAPDLHAVDSWPAFKIEALRTGARALFGYPLQIADSCVGALGLYTTRTGPLGGDRHEDALFLADLSSRAVTASLAAGSMGATALDFDDVVRGHDEVHQATGMLSVQLRTSVANAVARLRARAFAEERSVLDVAKDVVAGRLRLEE